MTAKPRTIILPVFCGNKLKGQISVSAARIVSKRRITNCPADLFGHSFSPCLFHLSLFLFATWRLCVIVQNEYDIHRGMSAR